MKHLLAPLLVLLAVAEGAEDGAATGSDYDLSERLSTKRWMNFHPNQAIVGETVEFTFKGFWPARGGTFVVRLSADANCAEVQVTIAGSLTTQEITLVGRKATFLMPSTTWTGGFCALINSRWHFIDNTLAVVAEQSETTDVMLGYQTCENYLYAQKKHIPTICGCYLQIGLSANDEALERYNPITIPTTFNNRELLNQISPLNLVQGCCNRWTPVKPSYVVPSGPTKTWGYCSGHNGA